MKSIMKAQKDHLDLQSKMNTAMSDHVGQEIEETNSRGCMETCLHLGSCSHKGVALFYKEKVKIGVGTAGNYIIYMERNQNMNTKC